MYSIHLYPNVLVLKSCCNKLAHGCCLKPSETYSPMVLESPYMCQHGHPHLFWGNFPLETSGGFRIPRFMSPPLQSAFVLAGSPSPRVPSFSVSDEDTCHWVHSNPGCSHFRILNLLMQEPLFQIRSHSQVPSGHIS